MLLQTITGTAICIVFRVLLNRIRDHNPILTLILYIVIDTDARNCRHQIQFLCLLSSYQDLLLINTELVSKIHGLRMPLLTAYVTVIRFDSRNV